MEKKELKKFLVNKGWDEKNAEKVLMSDHIDWSMTMKKWRTTFVGTFLTEKPNLLHILDYFCRGAEQDIPDWSDITPQQMRDVRNYLTTQGKALNSVKTYLANIKAVLNLNADKVGEQTIRQMKKAVKVKNEPTQHIALTEVELELIHRYQPRTQTEADVKRDFMIEAYCGARNSDARNITEANIKGGWLTYVSQKTRTKTSVPVHRNLLAYLAQPKAKEHSRKVVIDTIRRICRRCGITEITEMFTGGKMQTKPRWAFVGSHTARRSFATQLATRGVPVVTIAKFMGHSSPDMTMRYICMETTSLSPDIQAFFN